MDSKNTSANRQNSMRYTISFADSSLKRRLNVDVADSQSVRQVKQIVEDFFKINTSTTGKGKMRIVLEYGLCDLQDDWTLNDLNIPTGSTLKCYTVEEPEPDFNIYVKFKRERLLLYSTEIDPTEASVLELRVYVSRWLGLPLSMFRLKLEHNDQELYDDRSIFYFDVFRDKKLVLETWHGWDTFLNWTVKGYTAQAMKVVSSDEYIRQYQMRCALYIAAHYGNVELLSTLLSMGFRVDSPVGEHPCRQWCNIDFNALQPDKSRLDYLKLEFLKCPVHEAVQAGQVKILNYIAKACVQALEQPDGYKLKPWRLALHNNHKDPEKNNAQKEVARFLLSKQFGGKIQILGRNVSIPVYAKLRRWCDRAKERVLAALGYSCSSFKRRFFFQEGLAGNAVLVDGYNNQFSERENAYERLRKRYGFYYFIDQDDKQKLGVSELYFRTVGLIKTNISKKSSLGSKRKWPADRPIPTTLPIWKQAVNRIIFRKTVRQYYDILVALEVEVDLDDLKLPGDSDEEAEAAIISEKIPKRNLNRRGGLILPKLGENRTYGRRDYPKGRVDFNPLLMRLNPRFNATADRPLSVKKYEHGKGHVFSQPKDYRRETLTTFQKYRQSGLTSGADSTRILEEVSRFRKKTWIQQVQLGAKIAHVATRRSLQNISHT